MSHLCATTVDHVASAPREAGAAHIDDEVLSLREELSDVVVADLPGDLADLELHETGCQAALAAFARARQASLVDFLR